MLSVINFSLCEILKLNSMSILLHVQIWNGSHIQVISNVNQAIGQQLLNAHTLNNYPKIMEFCCLLCFPVLWIFHFFFWVTRSQKAVSLWATLLLLIVGRSKLQHQNTASLFTMKARIDVQCYFVFVSEGMKIWVYVGR